MPFLKTHIAVVNLSLIIFGALIISLGATVVPYKNYFNDTAKSFFGYEDISVLLHMLVKLRIPTIIVGSFLVFLGSVGCLGACLNSQCFLALYISTLLILAFMVFIFLICGVLYPNSTKRIIQYWLFQSLKYYKGDDTFKYEMTRSEEIVSFSWNFMQIKMRCCGAYNYTDFYREDHVQWMESDRGIPITCCKKVTNNYNFRSDFLDIIRCRSPLLIETFINNQSCFKAFEDKIAFNQPIVIFATSLILAVFVMHIVIASLVRKSRKRHRLSKVNRW